MREVKRTALVTQTPAQMFALVEDFERYPEFLPWVAGARLLSRSTDEQVGELQMKRMGVQERFTTRNTLFAPTAEGPSGGAGRLHMRLVDGPFNHLDGEWRFTPLMDAQGVARGTKVELEIRFEFKNAMLDMLMGKAFETSCASLVEAFTERARKMYG